MSPAPILIAALPFPLAYEVSCRTRTGSVRREQRAQRFAPANIGSPVLPGRARHEHLRQTSKLSTTVMLLPCTAGINATKRHKNELILCFFVAIGLSTDVNDRALFRILFCLA